MEENNSLFRSKKWLALSYILMISVLYTYIDLPFTIQISQIDWLWQSYFMQKITLLGSGYIAIPIFFAAVFFKYGYTHKKFEFCFWFILSQMLLSGLICDGIKYVVSRSRPLLWFSDHLYGFYWFKTDSHFWSFPSGHTCTIFSMIFGLVYFFPRFKWLWFGIGALVAFSRIACGMHYLSDVIMGIGITLVLARVCSTKMGFQEHLIKPIR